MYNNYVNRKAARS